MNTFVHYGESHTRRYLPGKVGIFVHLHIRRGNRCLDTKANIPDIVAFSNGTRGYIATGKSSTYRFDDIWELHTYDYDPEMMKSKWSVTGLLILPLQLIRFSLSLQKPVLEKQVCWYRKDLPVIVGLFLFDI